MNKKLHDATIIILHNKEKTSINHMTMYKIRYLLIAVSIKIKRVNVNENDVNMQLKL